VLASSVVKHRLEFQSDQTKDYKISIFAASLLEARSTTAFRSKSKDLLGHAFKVMSTRGLLFQ
jgi:hypothetical protein